MLPKSLLAFSILLSGVWAGPTATTASSATSGETDTESATRTSTASGITTHTIAVGAAGHKFTPDSLTAAVGDIIEWRFYPTSHWVIRGDFYNPCIPYEYVDTDRVGFSSGEQSVQAITDDGPRFRVRVNGTDPIFFYCGAPGSCVRYHMMGVVNPTKNMTLDDWVDRAKDVDYQLRPGDPWPTEGDTTKPSGAVTETGKASNDDNDDDDDNGGHGLSAGAIAGISIGAAATLLLAGALIYLCGRRGGLDKAYRKSFRNSSAPAYSPTAATVAETRFDSPNSAPVNMWHGHKQPSPMSAYAQSSPMSPHHAGVNYFHAGFNPVMTQEGTMGSYYSDRHAPQLVIPPPQPETPKPSVQTSPAELPASADPGNSPLPDYDNLRDGQQQQQQQQRVFSWAGEETAYRPAK